MSVHETLSILVVRLSSMGDIVHALPAFHAIRRTYPSARLGWVVENSHSQLLRGLEGLDNLYILDRSELRSGSWRRKRAHLTDVTRQLRQVKWGWAVDFQGLFKSYLIARRAGARRILGYRPAIEPVHPFYSDPVHLPTLDRHAVDRNLDLVTAGLGVGTPDDNDRVSTRGDLLFRLPVMVTHRRTASEKLAELEIPPGQRPILVNFSARKPANRWGVDRFAEFCSGLENSGLIPVLIGGPTDRDQAEAISQRVPHLVRSLVGTCSLMELVAVMEQSAAIVTGDTGPMHLAVAAGLPVVALFGPANPVRTGPYSSGARVIQVPRDCQPCYARHCRFGPEPPECLLDITVEDALRALEATVMAVEGHA